MAELQMLTKPEARKRRRVADARAAQDKKALRFIKDREGCTSAQAAVRLRQMRRAPKTLIAAAIALGVSPNTLRDARAKRPDFAQMVDRWTADPWLMGFETVRQEYWRVVTFEKAQRAHQRTVEAAAKRPIPSQAERDKQLDALYKKWLKA